MKRILIGLSFFSTVACTPPPEAPSDLEDLCEYIFSHIDDEEPTELQAGLDNLSVWLQTGENLNSTIEGYQVNNLKNESVADLDSKERTIQESLVGAAVGHSYEHSLDEIVQTMFVDDWSKVSGGTYSCYERVYDNSADPSCLLDQSCDQASYQTVSVSSWAGLVTVVSENSGQVRLVDTENGTAVVQRTWLNEPADTSGVLGNSVNVYAQYYVNIVLPTADGSLLRTTATWIDGEYFIEDQDFAKNQMIKTMQDQNTIITEWIESDKSTESSCLCSNYDYEVKECTVTE